MLGRKVEAKEKVDRVIKNGCRGRVKEKGKAMYKKLKYEFAIVRRTLCTRTKGNRR